MTRDLAPKFAQEAVVQLDGPALPGTRIKQHAVALGGAPGSEISGVEPAGAGDRIRFQDGAIYAGPETPECWVHGSIGDRYDELGGAAGWLGLPMTDDMGTPDGRGRYNQFQHGWIYWTATTGALEVHGAIRDKWAAMGSERGFLGYPVSDEMGTPDGNGRYSDFEHGHIYWTPTTGAFEIHGAIRDKWVNMGAERSFLGFPLSDETPMRDGSGKFNQFEGGSIYWTPKAGAVALHDKSLPDTLSAHTDIRFEGGTPVGGSADVVLNSNGTFRYTGHLNDSGLPDYTVTVACAVVVERSATAYTFVHTGTLLGTLTPGPRTDDWNDVGTRQELAESWLALCAGHEMYWQTTVKWSPTEWINTVKAAYPYVRDFVAMVA